MLDELSKNPTDQVEPTKADAGETGQKNLANESGAWVKDQPAGDGKATTANPSDKKDENGSVTPPGEGSGLSLLGLLQETNDEAKNLWNKWTQVDDKTYQDTQGDTVKVIAPDAQLFSKYDFKDQAATGSYLDMNSGTVVKPDATSTAAVDKTAPAQHDSSKDSPSPAGLSWLKEVTTFFGFGDKGTNDKSDAKDAKDGQDGSDKQNPVQTHEFTDKSGHPVKVEVGDGQAVHESNGVKTIKNADGVVRTDKTATTEWTPGKVEVTSADKQVNFKQDGQNATLDWANYTVTKMPGDKFQFTDKKTGDSVELAGDAVREHIGKTVFLALSKGQDLDKAVAEEKTKGPNDHLIAATDGKGTTLIKEPDGVRILIKEGKSATATYPDGTQISTDVDGTRKIKDKEGHVTVLKPGEDAPKGLKLPAGVGFDENGQLCLLKSGVSIDKNGHMHGLHGLHVDMKKNEIDMEDETNGKYSKLINRSGATTLTKPDGSVLNIDGSGHTKLTTAGGEVIKYDAEKRELETSKATFTPDHVTLWNGEKIYKDSSVRFSNGDVIARDGSATFADGTHFSSRGLVTTPDGWHTQAHYGHGATDDPVSRVDSGFVQRAINIYTGAEVSSAALYKNNITDADIASAEANLGNLDSLIALLSRQGAIGPATELAGLRGQLMGAIGDARARLSQQPNHDNELEPGKDQVR